MRKSSMLITALVISGVLNAQSIASINLGFNKLDKDDAFILTPESSFDSNNHAWRIGPTLLYSFGDQVEERETIKLTGLALGYDHFIHGKSEKWNMFHSFDFLMQRIKDEQDSQFFDTDVENFVPNRITQIDNSLFVSASAGVLLNLSERLSLSQTIGVGANAVFRNTESIVETFKDKFISQQWSLKTSIRFNL